MLYLHQLHYFYSSSSPIQAFSGLNLPSSFKARPLYSPRFPPLAKNLYGSSPSLFSNVSSHSKDSLFPSKNRILSLIPESSGVSSIVLISSNGRKCLPSAVTKYNLPYSYRLISFRVYCLKHCFCRCHSNAFHYLFEYGC